MSSPSQRIASYARELAALVSTAGVNELTYYPALQSLLAGLLRDRGLPFQVRVGTSQYRPTGGADMPDLAFYDGTGDTMATLMLEGGADVRFIQEMLGHANLQTTQIYTRVSIQKLKAIHDATHPGAKLRPAATRAAEAKTQADRAALLQALEAEAREDEKI